jgi:hypothetical protein
MGLLTAEEKGCVTVVHFPSRRLDEHDVNLVKREALDFITERSTAIFLTSRG